MPLAPEYPLGSQKDFVLRQRKANTLSATDVASAAANAGFKGEALAIAVAVAKGESSYNANAIHRTVRDDGHLRNPLGLWQIRYDDRHWRTGKERDSSQLYEPRFNAKAAYAVSNGGTNWRPWTVYTSGKYRQYMTEARSAASSAQAGSAAGDDYFTDPEIVKLPTAPGVPGSAVAVRIGGVGLAGELGNALIDGRVDLALAEASEIRFTFDDRGQNLLRKHKFDINTTVTYQGLRFSITSVETDQGQGGNQLNIVAEDYWFHRLNTFTGLPALTSPYEYIRRLSVKAGMVRYYGDPDMRTGTPQTWKPEKVSTSLQDPLLMLNPDAALNETNEREETAWEMIVRISKDFGCLPLIIGNMLYVVNSLTLQNTRSVGTLFCYNPLIVKAPPSVTPSGTPLARGSWVAMIGAPTISATRMKRYRTSKTGLSYRYSGVTGRCLLPPELGRALPRPGLRIVLAGDPIGENVDGSTLTITRVGWDIGNAISPVDVEFAMTTEIKQIPTSAPGYDAGKEPVSQPPSSSPFDPDIPGNRYQGPAVTSPRSGSKLAVDMVSFCLAQKGKRYIYGAEVRLTDPSPPAFDCSELVQWACAQVGINFPDGTGPQWEYCRNAKTAHVSDFEQAYRTRGALLWRLAPDQRHIVVSLGNGRDTIEAANSRVGVIIGKLSRSKPWTGWATVPGLKY